MELVIRTSSLFQSTFANLRHRASVRQWANERGEGVISAAIAVLIIAAVGVGAWASFNSLFDKASSKASAQVDLIGK